MSQTWVGLHVNWAYWPCMFFRHTFADVPNCYALHGLRVKHCGFWRTASFVMKKCSTAPLIHQPLWCACSVKYPEVAMLRQHQLRTSFSRQNFHALHIFTFHPLCLMVSLPVKIVVSICVSKLKTRAHAVVNMCFQVEDKGACSCQCQMKGYLSKLFDASVLIFCCRVYVTTSVDAEQPISVGDIS